MNNGNDQEKITSFTKLNAWIKAHQLVIEIYRITQKFPKEELFGLTNQLRRAGVSISSNIAEGFSRNSLKEKVQFYSTALGSLTEVQSQLMIARDIGYLEIKKFNSLYDQAIVISKLINGLIKKLRLLIHNP